MTSAPIANGDFTPILGSDLYYATLYVPAPQRRALSLIEALRAQIAAVPFTVSNPELAFTKLSWWHEEAHRLNANEARHALTRALAPVQNAYPQLGPAMLALIDGILALQQTGRFATSDERFALYDRAHGALWAVHATVAGITGERDIADVRRLGVWVELAYALRDTRRHIDSGLALLTREHEPASQLGLSDWYAAAMRYDIDGLLAALPRARIAVRALNSAALRAVLVFSVLAEATLTEIARDGYRVWERRVELTALRKLWLSLKTRIAI